MKKARWFVLAAVTLGFFLYLYFTEGADFEGAGIIPKVGYVFSKLKYVFSHIDTKYLFLAILFQLICICNDALSMHYIRLKYQKISYLYTLHSTFFGISIGSLLPGFLSAGAVSEIGIMNTQGLDVHKASSMVLARQVANFISICFFPLCFIIAHIGYFRVHSTLLLNICYALGFIINLLTIFFYAFIARANRFLFKLAKGIISFLAFLRIVKDKEKLLNTAKKTLDSLREQMANLPLKPFDWGFLIAALCMNILLGNLVSYCSASALGVQLNGTFSQMVASSGFVSAIQSTLPVPSGIGIADFAYINIMQPLVGENNVTYLHLLWRIITFYLPIMISAIVMVFPIPRNKKLEQSKQISENTNID